jgi:hypothetical protein
MILGKIVNGPCKNVNFNIITISFDVILFLEQLHLFSHVFFSIQNLFESSSSILEHGGLIKRVASFHSKIWSHFMVIRFLYGV